MDNLEVVQKHGRRWILTEIHEEYVQSGGIILKKEIDEIEARLERASERLQAVAQGRVYVVGTKVLYQGNFGVVTYLNQGSTDPSGSTIDIRLDDGKVVENVKVTSATLELFRH
jgi:hypothetical protein